MTRKNHFGCRNNGPSFINLRKVAILGGTPLPEKRHRKWNFVLSTERSKIENASVAWSQLDRSVVCTKVVEEDNMMDSMPLPTAIPIET